MSMTAEDKLLAISLLTAITDNDAELVEAIIEINPSVGSNAIILSLGMTQQLLHAQPLDDKIGMREVFVRMREAVTSEL